MEKVRLGQEEQELVVLELLGQELVVKDLEKQELG